MVDFLFGVRGTCTYCGEPADSIDHCIPYTWFRSNGYTRRSAEAVGFRTYACRECNSIAGSRIFRTFQEKASYINTRLRVRHRKEMGVIWDEEELSEVSGRLRQYLEQQNRNNLKQRERVSWQSSTSYFALLKSAADQLYYREDIDEKVKLYLIDEDYVP